MDLSLWYELPVDECIHLANEVYSSVNGSDEVDAQAAITIASASFYMGGYGDYVFSDAFEVNSRIVKYLPSVIHLLIPNFKLRASDRKPNSYYTKKSPLNDSSIRELTIYLGFETQVEFYGYDIYSEGNEWFIDLYIEKGDYDLTEYVHGDRRGNDPYDVLVKGIEPVDLLPTEKAMDILAQMQTSFHESRVSHAE